MWPIVQFLFNTSRNEAKHDQAFCFDQSLCAKISHEVCPWSLVHICHYLDITQCEMYGPRLPVSLTAWRWISTLHVLAQHFLYALVLTYSQSLTLKHGAIETPTEILSITNTNQVYRSSGNTKRMSRTSRTSWQGTVQLTWACEAEMKPLLALQGENMLQWTRSTERHTAVEIWNHLSLVLGPSQHCLCTSKDK